VRFRGNGRPDSAHFQINEGPLLAYSVEKLCFEMSDDFICDLSGIVYCSYEGVAEVV